MGDMVVSLQNPTDVAIVELFTGQWDGSKLATAPRCRQNHIVLMAIRIGTEAP